MSYSVPTFAMDARVGFETVPAEQSAILRFGSNEDRELPDLTKTGTKQIAALLCPLQPRP
jgi:hypothetical protein